MADAVKRRLEEIRSDLPPGYEMIEAMDLSRFIRSAIHDVAVDLAWGALLASLVVLLFLRNTRSTVIAASLDVMAQIAFLMLMGVVMKNGILLVDYTNILRRRGRPLFEAVLDAGPTRMRPVLMTAVSTIFGMLPVALGRGDGSEWRSPMGVIAIGGLATSTMLTLLVVPVVYTLVDEAGAFLLRLARRLRPGGATGTGPARPESAPSRRPARAKGR